MRWFFAFLVLTLCVSCGYHFSNRGSNNCSICVPYVEGDDSGMLTNALIRSLSSRSALAYSTYDSDFILKVCLQPPEDTNIGFEYAPKAHDIIVSNEARVTLKATIRLIDRRTGSCVLGPCDISSSLDYDFEPDLGNVNFHAFSLGQLEMHGLALDAATTSLYSILAEQIADNIAYIVD